jgi:hypothetical protein
LGDDDRRPTLPVPVATGMNRSGHLSCGWRRRRRRLILRLILWLILRERLPLDAPHRRGLRHHLVSRRRRLRRRVRIVREPYRLGAAGRGTHGNRRQGTEPQCQMRPPPRCFSPHDDTRTQTPHPHSGELNSTEVNISLNFRRWVNVIRAPHGARARQRSRNKPLDSQVIRWCSGRVCRHRPRRAGKSGVHENFQSSRACPGSSGTKRTPIKSSRATPSSVRVSRTRDWLP